jgi:hypothetical protein
MGFFNDPGSEFEVSCLCRFLSSYVKRLSFYVVYIGFSCCYFRGAYVVFEVFFFHLHWSTSDPCVSRKSGPDADARFQTRRACSEYMEAKLISVGIEKVDFATYRQYSLCFPTDDMRPCNWVNMMLGVWTMNTCLSRLCAEAYFELWSQWSGQSGCQIWLRIWWNTWQVMCLQCLCTYWNAWPWLENLSVMSMFSGFLWSCKSSKWN